MANSQAMCTSFKKELLTGKHNFGVGVVRASTAADTFKAALYYTTGTLGAGTTAYSSTDEVAGTNYTAGGVNVTNATAPNSSGTTAFWTPSATISFPTITIASAFDSVLIYNSTQGGAAVSVHTFGAQTITAGTLDLTMPTNDAANALIRIA